MDRFSRDRLIPPRQANPGISQATESAILAAMALNPPARPQSVSEFRQMLGGPSQVAKASVAPALQSVGQRPRPVRRSSIALFIVGFIGLAALLVAISRGFVPGVVVPSITPRETRGTPTLITLGNVARLNESVRIPGRAQQLAFAPDGQTLALAETDGVALWNLRTVSQTGFITTSVPSVVAFSPDGRWLLAGSKDNILQLRDVLSHDTLAGFEGHTAAVTDVVFDITGRLAASSSQDESVRVWDMINHSGLYRLEGHTDWVMSVAFSPNGDLLASAGRDALVQLWDTSSGTLIWSFRGHEGPVSSVAINPDGKLLASGGEDNTVRLWDLEGHTLVRTLTGHLGGVTSVAFSPDGRVLASSSKDGTVRLWETVTGVELRTLKGHNGEVLSMGFDPSGYWIASAGSDGVVTLWGVK
jgi:WD40 repeat protein